MHYHIVQKKGFPIDTDLASELDLLDEFLLWEEQEDAEEFCNQFEDRYGITPESLLHFEYSTDGHVKNLEGFEWDKTYVVFDEEIQDSDVWDHLDEVLNEQDVFLEEGEWREIN